MLKYLKVRNLPVALPLLLLLAGCGGADHPDLFKVSGIVTYNGDPVEGATVQFNRETGEDTETGASRSSRATTDANGYYELETFKDGKGAPAGEYAVVVTKTESMITGKEDDYDALDPESAGAIDDELSEVGTAGEGDDEAEEEGPQSELPAKYGNPSTTPFKKTVTAEGPNEFNLELNDE